MEDEVKTTETAQEQEQEKAKTYSEQEYNALVEQLNTANATIQSYKDMDIDSIKASVEDYKSRLEQSEQARKDFEYRTKISGYVKALGLKDDIYEKYVSDIIIEKKLQFEGEKLIGGDDIISDFKAKYPDAFKSEKPVPEFSTSTAGQSGVRNDDAFVRSIMGLK